MVGLFRHIIEQRVLANLLFLVLLAAGLLVVPRMPVEEYPNESLDKVLIVVPWPGAAADEVEREVAREVEEQIAEVSGIEWIQSSSFPDRCEVWVKVRSDVDDFEAVVRDIQIEVSALRDLPEGSEAPLVKKIDVEEMGPVLQIVVGWSGGGALNAAAIEQTLKEVAEELDAQLEQLPEVKRVRVYGTRDRELKVELDPRRLEALGLTVEDVARALAARNVALPAGSLEGHGREVMVRGSAQLPDVRAFEEVVIRSDAGGATARLGEVARLDWGFEKASVRSFFRGQACVTMAVVKEETGNAIRIAAEVREALEAARAKLPRGVTLDVVADTTVRVQERVAVLQTNILLGLVLVLSVLWMSIGFKNAVLGSLGIPFSFLVSLIVLSLGGESVNVISLFSMVLVLGVIVDDALVVLENVHRHAEMGKALPDAVAEGTAEVAVPVCSATLTTIAAFLPLLLMPGSTGRFFAIIPKTVSYALMASLFECLIILPVHILDLGPTKAKAAGPSGLVRGMRGLYARALWWALRLRYLSIVGLVVLAWGAGWALGRIPVVFFPSDFKQFFINVSLPVGAPLEETRAMTLRVAELVEAMPEDEIESALVTVGLSFDSNYKTHNESHLGQLFVTTARAEVKRRSVQEIMARVRERLAAARLVGARIEVAELSDGPPVGKPITIRLQGDELEALEARSAEVARVLAGLEGVSNVASDLRLGRDELRFRLEDGVAARLGVTAAEVAQAVAFANDGAVLTSWSPPGADEAVDVRVQVAAEARREGADLERLRVRTRGGALVPLGELVEVERRRGWAALHRFEGRRAVTVTADVDARVTSAIEAAQRAREVVERLPPAPGVVVGYEGEFAETERSFASLQLSFIIAIGCIFMVLGAQFQSFLQPLVVLLTVPFSFIGVAYGLWLTGDPFTIASGIAIVGLAGMVVNDSLVLVDFVNRLRREGRPVVEALVEGAVSRLRAIILTTVTTVFGVLPMALGVGGRSPVWSPMATSIAFGLSFATALTLFVIPCALLILEDVLAAMGRGEVARFEGEDMDS